MNRRLRALIVFSFFALSSTATADHGGVHVDINLDVPATSSTGNYTATWTAGSFTYELQEKLGSGGYSTIYTGTGSSYNVTVTQSGTYTYRVRWEFCFLGECDWHHSYTDSIVVTLALPPPSAITGPDTDSDGTFALSWGASSGATSYELQRNLGGGAWSTIQNTSSTARNETGLTAGTYNYRVRACDSANCSSWTATKTVLVLAPPGTPGVISGPVAITDSGNGVSYTLTWGVPTGTVDYYQVERDSGAGWVQIAAVTTEAYSQPTIGVGRYGYRVRACNDGGCGPYNDKHIVEVMQNNLSTFPGLGTVDSVGTVPYDLDVGSDGDTLISVPLLMMPGMVGFEPSLSFEYDSGRGVDRLDRSLPEDTIGYGWRVAGLSAIRRCVINQGSSNAINLTGSDSLCLDGVPLVLTSGAHVAAGATYRTLIESYIKIEAKGESNDLWFEAILPDGTVQEYGHGVGSRVNHSGGTDYQWSISRAINSDNREIAYEYFLDASNGVNYVTNIQYEDNRVDFEYQARSDAAAVPIGSASQTQSVLLHTITVGTSGGAYREYRLATEHVAGRSRLNEIQLCGYSEDRTAMSCLNTLDIGWLTPSTSITRAEILVDSVLDGLGAVHEVEYKTLPADASAILFTEDPFSDSGTIPDSQTLTQAGEKRHVVTRLKREDGLDVAGQFHETSYEYFSDGRLSTKHWGFLGFPAQKVIDEQSGIVTYIQYRLDYPYFGRVAKLIQYDADYGSHTSTLTRAESDHAQQAISHTQGTTVYPYTNANIDFIFEGSYQLGATLTANTLSFVSGLLDQVDTTVTIGTSISAGSAGSIWGDVPSYSLSGIKHTSEKSVEFNNRTAAQWLVGFVEGVSTESWKGAKSGAGILRDATFTPHASSLKVASAVRFPNHSDLTLQSDYWYDSYGRNYKVRVSGDNVAARETIRSFHINQSYPNTITNAKGHVTNLTQYDVRFGTLKLRGDVNGRNHSWERDPFGQVTKVTNGDDVETTTVYADCPSGCGITIYGVAPAFKVTVDSIISPKEIAYLDRLGRPIRTEIELLTGYFSKRDVKYDALGRIEKTTLPYIGGTPNEVVPTYDIRNRVKNISRPDGSSTQTVITSDGQSVFVTVTDNVLKADGTSAGTQKKHSKYNILGQLEQTTDGYGTTLDPGVSYTFDALGNLLTATVDGGSSGTTVTTFTVDEAGNQKTITGPNIGTVTTTYTALNELRTVTDNKSQVSTYTFDTLGRLETLQSVDGTSTWQWDTATNGKGKLDWRSNGNGFTEHRTYSTSSKLSTVITEITPIGSSTPDTYSSAIDYDAYGRPDEITYPSGLVITRTFNAYGYLSTLKEGTATLQSFTSMDALGNVTGETYGNGVDTARVFDPETGRLTSIETKIGGSTYFQDNEYKWRSNGTLESRLANPVSGITSTREEKFSYDVLNRLEKAETFINGSNTRDLDYSYSELGNITSKTSTLSGDTDVTGFGYGAGTAGPHAVTTATVNGTLRTLTYDANGAVEKYDIAGTSDDKYIAYNAFNRPTTIVVGGSLTDTTPVAKDEFAYGPDGQRYARKTSWQEILTETEWIAYIGDVEVIKDTINDDIDRILKTKVGPNVMHVKVEGWKEVNETLVPWTETHYEYAHRDHLGSIEAVTDENGFRLHGAAFEPNGSRKAMDWSSNISAAELAALLGRDWDRSPRVRGFTDHEHLDRTGFVHMNGRVFDPVLGRFLSPDPIVSHPTYSQSWNRFSYVLNSPVSLVDPTGYEDEEPIDEITVYGSRSSGNRAPVYYHRLDGRQTIMVRLEWVTGDANLCGAGGLYTCNTPIDMELGYPNVTMIPVLTDVSSSMSHAIAPSSRRIPARSDGDDSEAVSNLIEKAGGEAAFGIDDAVSLAGIGAAVTAIIAELKASLTVSSFITNLARMRHALKIGAAAHVAKIADELRLLNAGNWTGIAGVSKFVGVQLGVIGGGLAFVSALQGHTGFSKAVMYFGVAGLAFYSAPVAIGVSVFLLGWEITGGIDSASLTIDRLFRDAVWGR